MKIDKTVADQLVSGTQSDIRQIINLLSTWKLGNQALTFDETKKLCAST
jgi:replication factor C subunit 1